MILGAMMASSENEQQSHPCTRPSAVVTRPRTLQRKIICAITHSPPEIKWLFILATVILGSSMHALQLSPGEETALADKRNPFNVLFVKWSWGWTLICIVPTVILTSALYTGLNKWAIMRHVSRVGVAHLIWYTMTLSFESLDGYYGECSDGGITSPRACVKQGKEWNGFDISGHIFLLTYCILILTEESANIKMEVWREYNGTLINQERVVSKLPATFSHLLPEMHRFLTLAVNLLEMLATAEMILWSIMLCTTSLYFHTLLEKLIAVAIAVGAWYLTYRVLYGRVPWLPSKPEEGLLHPVRQLNEP